MKYLIKVIRTSNLSQFKSNYR